MSFLEWLSDPFKWLSDLQLGDQKVTLNHLVYGIFSLHFPCVSLIFMKVDLLGQKNYPPLSDQALLRQLRCAEEESRESLELRRREKRAVQPWLFEVNIRVVSFKWWVWNPPPFHIPQVF